MVAIGPVLHIVGLLMSIMAVAMLLPAGVDLSLIIPTGSVRRCVGAVAVRRCVADVEYTKPSATNLSLRQAFLTTLSWLTIAAVAALPLLFLSST